MYFTAQPIRPVLKATFLFLKSVKKCHEQITLFLFDANEKHKTVSRGCTLPIKQPRNSMHGFPPNQCCLK